jgi:hypothetical protein
MTLNYLVVPIRQDEKRSRTGDTACEVLEQIEGGLVGPAPSGGRRGGKSVGAVPHLGTVRSA